MPRRNPVWRPSQEQMRHWPPVSGNAINGVGEETSRRPSPIYWHPPETIPHGPLQSWFYQRTGSDETLAEARRERQQAIDEPLVPVAAERVQVDATAMTEAVKTAAAQCGADDVGVTPMRPDYVFAGHDVPNFPWMIVLAVEQSYDAMAEAPSMRALVEVTRQYARGTRAAKGLANRLRAEGFAAFPYGGPMAGSFLLIPAAIEAGLGELGKHGSIIHPRFGANFRLACVLTDAPLVADVRDVFRRRRILSPLPCLLGRLSARRHPSAKDNGAGRAALVRRLRQVPSLLQRSDELRDLPRRLSVQPTRGRRQPGRETGREACATRDPIADREFDHPPPGPGKGLNPARVDPGDAMVGGEAGDQQDRLAAIRPLGGYVDIGDVDAVGGEGLEHRRRYGRIFRTAPAGRGPCGVRSAMRAVAD